MATSQRSEPIQAQLTFLSEGLLAKPSLSQESERDWMIRVATSRLSFLRLLADYGPDGWSGRTCLACCQSTEDGRLEPFSDSWGNSGTGGPTESWTLSTLEFHSGAVASSLSDILETGDVPRRYFLSATACAGILRRAAKRGKNLPALLAAALASVAGAMTSTAPERSSP